jgi:hypothetical protein
MMISYAIIVIFFWAVMHDRSHLKQKRDRLLILDGYESVQSDDEVRQFQ